MLYGDLYSPVNKLKNYYQNAYESSFPQRNQPLKQEIINNNSERFKSIIRPSSIAKQVLNMNKRSLR